MTFLLGPKATKAGVGLKVFAETGSTNIDAMDYVRAGGQAPCWFVTTMQTAGRGRRNRAWIAPRGNLASSVLEILDVTPSVAATLGFAAGVALVRALQHVSAEAVMRAPDSAVDYQLKWPNDILAGGGKLVGMNLEAESLPTGQLAVVVGMGTNVVAAPENIAYSVAHLHGLGVSVSAEDLFYRLSDAWEEARGIWDAGRGFRDIRKMWLAQAVGVGEPVSVVNGGQTTSGIFDTIDETGCMVVATADRGRVAISAGDVHFGSAASTRISAI